MLEPPEELILEARINRDTVGDMFAYSRGEHTYLPFIQFAEIIGFAAELKELPDIVVGAEQPLLPAYTLSVRDDRSLVYKDHQKTLTWSASQWLADFLELDGEVYLRSDLYEKIWPLSVQVNFRRLRVLIHPKGKLPVVSQLARKRYRQSSLRPQQVEAARLRLGLPYETLSSPLIDWNTSLRYSRLPTTLNTTLRTRQDAFHMGSRANIQLETTAAGTSVRSFGWQSVYQASDDGNIPELAGGIRRVELGNIRVASSSINSVAFGTGIAFATFDDSRSVFAPHTVTGAAPPGWEVDLFLDQSLIGYQLIDDDGIYSFDLMLRPGRNTVNVRLYGPHGEERVDRYVFNISPIHLDKGDWGFKFSALSPQRHLYSDTDADSIYSTVLTSTLGYGLGSGTDVRFIHSYKTFKERYDPAHILGAELTKSLGPVFFELEGYAEGADTFASVGASYALDDFSTVMRYAHHRNWPDAQREGRDLKEYFSWLLDYDLFFWGKQIDARAYWKYEALEDEYQNTVSLRQSFSASAVSYTLSQRCQFAEQRTCDFGAQSRFSAAGTRISVGLESRLTSEKQQRHQAALQWSIPGRLMMPARWRSAASLPSGGVFWRWLMEDARLNIRYSSYYQTQSGDRHELDEYWGVSLASSYLFRYLKAGLSLGWNNTNGLVASVSFSGSLYPEPGGGYHSVGAGVANPARLRVFADKDYNGVWSDGDEALEGIGIWSGSQKSKLSDAEGVIWHRLSENDRLDLNYNTMDDPYSVLGRSIQRQAVRNERVSYIDLPIIETGAIEGILTQQTGAVLANYKLELVNVRTGAVTATMYSGLDGFFVFEFIPPGDYRIEMARKGQNQVLGHVALSHDDLWPVIDLVVKE